MGFQEGAGMKVSDELSCMANYLESEQVTARLINSYYYGNNGGYYEPTQQLTGLGNYISSAAAACPDFWQELWGDIEEVAV